jgi:hypothetical protein
MALWQWLFTRIEPRKSRLKNPTGQKLGTLLDTEKKHQPVKLAQIACLLESSRFAIPRAS